MLRSSRLPVCLSVCLSVFVSASNFGAQLSANLFFIPFCCCCCCCFCCSLKLKLLNLLLELQVRKATTRHNASNAHNAVSADVESAIMRVVESNRHMPWHLYKLARMCVRYSQYKLACAIYESLAALMVAAAAAGNNDCAAAGTTNVSTSDMSYKGWLDFMAQVCRAEALVSSGAVTACTSLVQLVASINEAFALYARAQTRFKSFCTRCLTATPSAVPVLDTTTGCFQVKYCELRSEQLKLYAHLVLASSTYRTAAAPVFQLHKATKATVTPTSSSSSSSSAAAAAAAMATTTPSLPSSSSAIAAARLGRIVHQMKYIVLELQKLNVKCKELASECFDADQHTINILHL